MAAVEDLQPAFLPIIIMKFKLAPVEYFYRSDHGSGMLCVRLSHMQLNIFGSNRL